MKIFYNDLTDCRTFTYRTIDTLESEIRREEESVYRKRKFANLLTAWLQIKKEISLDDYTALLDLLDHTKLDPVTIFHKIFDNRD